MPLISLLKKKEIKYFDSPTILTDQQRATVFQDVDIEELEHVFRRPVIKIGFILQHGYFSMYRKFFVPHRFHREDIDFVAKLCNQKSGLDISLYKRPTYIKHRTIILGLYR